METFRKCWKVPKYCAQDCRRIGSYRSKCLLQLFWGMAKRLKKKFILKMLDYIGNWEEVQSVTHNEEGYNNRLHGFACFVDRTCTEFAVQSS